MTDREATVVIRDIAPTYITSYRGTVLDLFEFWLNPIVTVPDRRWIDGRVVGRASHAPNEIGSVPTEIAVEDARFYVELQASELGDLAGGRVRLNVECTVSNGRAAVRHLTLSRDSEGAAMGTTGDVFTIPKPVESASDQDQQHALTVAWNAGSLTAGRSAFARRRLAPGATVMDDERETWIYGADRRWSRMQGGVVDKPTIGIVSEGEGCVVPLDPNRKIPVKFAKGGIFGDIEIDTEVKDGAIHGTMRVNAVDAKSIEELMRRPESVAAIRDAFRARHEGVDGGGVDYEQIKRNAELQARLTDEFLERCKTAPIDGSFLGSSDGHGYKHDGGRWNVITPVGGVAVFGESPLVKAYAAASRAMEADAAAEEYAKRFPVGAKPGGDDRVVAAGIAIASTRSRDTHRTACPFGTSRFRDRAVSPCGEGWTCRKCRAKAEYVGLNMRCVTTLVAPVPEPCPHDAIETHAHPDVGTWSRRCGDAGFMCLPCRIDRVAPAGHERVGSGITVADRKGILAREGKA